MIRQIALCRIKRLVASALLLALLLMVTSCQAVSWPWSSSEVATVEAPKQTATAEILDTVSESLWRFGWISILLVLFFPRVREPLLGLWMAMLRALAIPFLAIRRWFDGGRDS